MAEPASPQELAARMRQRQREARGTQAKHRFEVTAMTDPGPSKRPPNVAAKRTRPASWAPAASPPVGAAAHRSR